MLYFYKDVGSLAGSLERFEGVGLPTLPLRRLGSQRKRRLRDFDESFAATQGSSALSVKPSARLSS